MQPLVEKYRPITLDGFTGLERPRALLAHLAAHPYESAWLFLGPSGIGKTTMALALAAQLGAQVQHVPSRQCDFETVKAICRSCWYAPMIGEWHLVLVDEADQMSKPAQLAFLSTLDTTARPPKTIFIFTANDTRLLEDRFLSRCRTIRFSTEGMAAPIAGLLAKTWAAEAPAFPAPDFLRIAQQSKLNIREALMLLELEMIAPSPEAESMPNRPPVISIDAEKGKRSAAAKRAWITIRARRAAGR